MSLIDELFPTPRTEFGSNAQDALRVYTGWNLRHKLMEKAADRFYESPEEELERVDKMLGIRLKRRALGLPMDDDDLDLANNEGLSFTQKGAVAAFGKHVSDRVPAPGFLTPKTTQWFNGGETTSKPLAATVRGAGEYLLSGGLRVAEGGRYGRTIRSVGKFFRGA